MSTAAFAPYTPEKALELKVIGARVSLKDYEIKWFDTGASMLRHKNAHSITGE